MADQMTPGVVNDPKHNVGARNACIQKGFDERFKLEQEEAAAIAKHVQPTKDAIKALNRKLKKDVDIDSKDLSLLYKIYARQEMARLLDDEADRDRIFDNLRATFEAIGGQLDFVDAMSAVEADKDDQPTEAVLDKARLAGTAAGEKGEDGKPPYPKGSESAKAWMECWTVAQAGNVESMSGNKAQSKAG